MLTKETPPNTFLMVRFKCCFSMNIVTVIQFVLKVFFSFSLSTVGTDHQKTYGGGGRRGEVPKKTYSRNRKLNEKKNHTRQLTLKKYLWYGLKKNHTRNLITEKNSCGSKILHPPLSNGPSLSDGEVDLGGHSFSPPLTP